MSAQLELDLGPVIGDIVELHHGAFALDSPSLRCRVTWTNQHGLDLHVVSYPTAEARRLIPQTLLGVPHRCCSVLVRC